MCCAFSALRLLLLSDAGPNLIGRYEIAVIRGSKPKPHRFRKTGFIIEETVDCLPNELVGFASIPGSELGKTGFLVRTQLNFHILQIRPTAVGSKSSASFNCAARL
jgi:hypothetical protein